MDSEVKEAIGCGVGAVVMVAATILTGYWAWGIACSGAHEGLVFIVVFLGSWSILDGIVGFTLMWGAVAVAAIALETLFRDKEPLD